MKITLDLILVVVLCGSLVGLIAYMLVALIVGECRRKRQDKLDLEMQLSSVEQLRQVECSLCISNDFRLVQCGEFMRVSVKVAFDAVAGGTPWRAEKHLHLAAIVHEWAKTLQRDPKLDTPAGEFTDKLLIALHLIRGQNHEAGNLELVALWVNRASPIALRQCVARAQAWSLRERGYHIDADQTDAIARALPHLCGAPRI